MSQALDWTYSAEIVPAEAARDAGLIKAVVPADRLLEEARALARRYTEHRSAVGTALTRQLMYRNAGASHPLEAHRVDSLAIFHQVRGDAREGMQAFAEKRAPQFPSRVSRDLPAFVAPWLRGETR
jgi:enoyl-CoA hydratase/carnithine racemase